MHARSRKVSPRAILSGTISTLSKPIALIALLQSRHRLVVQEAARLRILILFTAEDGASDPF